MKKWAEKIAEGALSEAGKYIFLTILAGVGAAWAWAANRWPAYKIGIAVLGIVSLLIILCAFIAYCRVRMKQQPPSQDNEYMIGPTVVWDHKKSIEEKPTEMAFHVLKYFYQFSSGAVDVKTVAYTCQIDEESALRCVQELWGLKYIHTAVPGVGEWNGRYKITEKGRKYVSETAT